MNKRTEARNEKLRAKFLHLLKDFNPNKLTNKQKEAGSKLFEFYCEATDASFDAQCTEPEINAKSYLDWDDVKMGQITRHSIERIIRSCKKKGEEMELSITIARAAAHILVNMARSTNAGEMELVIKGMTYKEKPVGNWKVIIKECK